MAREDSVLKRGERLLGGVLALLAWSVASGADADANACDPPSRLDPLYQDADCDLLADPPSNPASLRNPDTLVWAYTPIENPAIYASLFKPFTKHLESCLERQIVYYPVQSNAAQVSALRSGRLHFAGFSTGPTVAAVRSGGAHPFAAKGDGHGIRGYRMIAVVKASSAFQRLGDLKGRRIAHTSAKSNSGNFAPRAYFPDQGLVPGADYEPIMSGSHDRSILGVRSGDYDMAAVASDVFERMTQRGTIRRDDFRILYQSPLFPTSSFVYAHDLDPRLVESLKRCFFSFRFTPEMSEAFQGDERFLPISYRRDWKAVRDIFRSDDDDANLRNDGQDNAEPAKNQGTPK